MAGKIIVAVFCCVICFTSAILLYRGNKAMTTAGRLIFAISTPPVFIFLMVLNFAFSSKYFPGLENFSQTNHGRRGAIAALIDLPLPAAFSFLWFKLSRFIFHKKVSPDEVA